jgi:hypothetical protein
MSKPALKIHFDEPPLRADVVTFAVAPMDAFSGRIVRSGVRAKVKGLPDRPIRNLTGHLVFKNLPDQDKYTVVVDPTEAGYFAPEDSDFPENADAGKTKLHLVRLMRRPEFPFESDVTLIRGVVVRGAGPGAEVSGAAIWTGDLIKPTDPLFNPSAPKPLRFETRSGRGGAFALPLTLPHSNDGATKAFPVTLHLQDGEDVRVLEDLQIKDGKPHSFCEPIDLTGRNMPGFFPCPELGGAT